jgi:hypothetical protein
MMRLGFLSDRNENPGAMLGRSKYILQWEEDRTACDRGAECFPVRPQTHSHASLRVLEAKSNLPGPGLATQHTSTKQLKGTMRPSWTSGRIPASHKHVEKLKTPAYGTLIPGGSHFGSPPHHTHTPSQTSADCSLPRKSPET